MKEYISGIQQIGIGVHDARRSLLRYAEIFGMDTLVFDDVSEATLMTRYTGGTVYKRQALLSLNMQGGGGFEIWQFQNRKPQEAHEEARYGDIGIFAARMKCADVERAQEYLRRQKDLEVSAIGVDGKGEKNFWVKDENGNVFQVVMSQDWFNRKEKICGGVTGAVIGVSDMERALCFYRSLLNIDDVVYDYVEESVHPLEKEVRRCRKVLLRKTVSDKGAFGKLLGGIEIELVQWLDGKAKVIFANRFWGDCGFIHLCFDVYDMAGLKQSALDKGYCFTVDSVDSFGMEAAAGRFCYVEDPDGTLMELVETHKVPIYKKLGLYLNLKKRNLEKPLPGWMIRLLSLSKVK